MKSLEQKDPGTEQGAAFTLSRLSDQEFQKLSSYIETNLGIRMPDTKRIMLESRLQRRLRVHGMNKFSDYITYIFSDDGKNTELIHMIDAVTTNKTDFFREADHFEYLTGYVLPHFIRDLGWGIDQPLKVWSAGCSSGEEPYTLSMVLEEFRAANDGFSFRILGTDISTRMLDTASAAIYPEERISPVPESLRKKYLLRSKDKKTGLIRIAPHLRSKVEFSRLNLMDKEYDIDRKFDVIFCRNVIIYFERTTQEEILNKLYSHLRPEGFLFLGHSETLCGMGIPLVSVAPTIYRKQKSGGGSRG